MNRRKALAALVALPWALIVMARVALASYHSAKEKNCGAISNNHDHEVCLGSGQLTAGKSVVLTLTRRHTHSLELSADQVRAINSGRTIGQIASGITYNHSHKVTFNA